MSGTQSAIDTLSADETALLDSMRDDGPEVVETHAPEPVEIDLDDVTEPTDDGADPTAPRQNKLVPHGQFHAANERRKVAEEKARTLEAKLQTTEAVVAERLRILTEAAQAAMPQPAPAAPIQIPDVDTDPVGHFKALNQGLTKELGDMQAILSGLTEGQRAAQQRAELQAWGSTQEAAYMKENPDYGQAMDFLTMKRAEQLQAIGITDPFALRQTFAKDVDQIAQRARADGANFADRLYKVAQSFGYQKAAPATPTVPALDAALDVPVTERAARIEQGRANSTSIASAGGAPPPRLTPERIANMPEAQFAEVVDKLRAKDPEAYKNLMGY